MGYPCCSPLILRCMLQWSPSITAQDSVVGLGHSLETLQDTVQRRLVGWSCALFVSSLYASHQESALQWQVHTVQILASRSQYHHLVCWITLLIYHYNVCLYFFWCYFFNALKINNGILPGQFLGRYLIKKAICIVYPFHFCLNFMLKGHVISSWSTVIIKFFDAIFLQSFVFSRC